MELCNFYECSKRARILFVLFVSLACAQSSQLQPNEIASDPGQAGKEGKDVVDFNSPLIRHKRGNTPGFVNIAQFIDRSGPGKIHNVYVDDSMTRMLFEVAVKNGLPVFIVQKPAGQNYNAKPSIKGNPSNGTVIATLDIPISSSDYGFWKFTKVDAATWNVTIKGKSSLYIKSSKFYEKGSNSSLITSPIIGKIYTMEVEVVGFPYIKTVDNYLLFTQSKLSPIAMNSLVQKGGNKFEAVSFMMPDKPFIVGIQGEDKSGHLYRRIDPTEIIPVTLSLDVSPHTDATMFEYSLFNISFVVTNLLSTKQEIDILVSDSRGFAQDPKTLSSNLKVGENFTGTFVIKSTYAGLTTLVKISTRQYLGNSTFREGPLETINIKVVKNETTTTSSPTPTSATTPGINSSGVSLSTPNSTKRFTQTISTLNITTPAVKSANVNGHSNSPTTVSTDTQTAHDRNTDTPDGDSGDKQESESSSMKVELSAGVIVASMVSGTVVGIVAIVTLTVIFKKAMTPKSKRVAPEDDKNVPERATSPPSLAFS